MKSLLVTAGMTAAAMLAISACAPVPPPPPPAPPPAPVAAPPPYVAPMPPPVAYRGCPPGMHWVRAHRSHRTGRWVRGHCAPNRW